MNSQLVSVLINTWNRPHFLEDAVVSLYNQDHRQLEVILNNDGSNDQGQTYRLIHELKEKYDDGRFANFLLHSQPHSGPNTGLNWMLHRTQGEYISVLDDDDILLPHYVSMLLDEFEDKPKLGVAYCHSICMDQDGIILGVLPSKPIGKKTVRTKSRVPGNALSRREAFFDAYPLNERLMNKIKVPRFAKIYDAGWDFKYKKMIGFLYRWHMYNISGIGNNPKEIFEKTKPYCETLWEANEELDPPNARSQKSI